MVSTVGSLFYSISRATLRFTIFIFLHGCVIRTGYPGFTLPNWKHTVSIAVNDIWLDVNYLIGQWLSMEPSQIYHEIYLSNDQCLWQLALKQKCHLQTFASICSQLGLFHDFFPLKLISVLIYVCVCYISDNMVPTYMELDIFFFFRHFSIFRQLR